MMIPADLPGQYVIDHHSARYAGQVQGQSAAFAGQRRRYVAVPLQPGDLPLFPGAWPWAGVDLLLCASPMRNVLDQQTVFKQGH